VEKYKILILINILIRIPLLFLTPISIFGDGLVTSIFHSYQLINFNFMFPDPPLFFLIEGLLTFIFSGRVLEFFWKVPAFLFFIGFLFLLPQVYRILKLNENEKLLLTALLIFPTSSLLYGSSIMIEMLVLFFAFAIFILIEKTEMMGKTNYFIMAILTSLMLYSKQTGLFILMGFFIYIFFKKIPIKNKFLFILSLTLGFVTYLGWSLKNYVLNIAPVATVKEAIFIPTISFFTSDLLTNIITSAKETYLRFWFIPLLGQVNFKGIFSVAYLGYYILFIILTLFLSFAIIFGIIKFGRRNFSYILLILPLCSFAVLWGFFVGVYGDIGRYSFTFHLFIYFYAVKFIENIKNIKIKRLIYVLIVLLVILFVMTAYATAFRMINKDSQIRQIANIIKNDNFTVIPDNSFARATLGYYSGKKIQEVIEIDKEIKIPKNMIFKSQDYQIFLKNETYYISES